MRERERERERDETKGSFAKGAEDSDSIETTTNLVKAISQVRPSPCGVGGYHGEGGARVEDEGDGLEADRLVRV